jgi:hypothetical protein
MISLTRYYSTFIQRRTDKAQPLINKHTCMLSYQLSAADKFRCSSQFCVCACVFVCVCLHLIEADWFTRPRVQGPKVIYHLS